ncbi:MAG TPA: glycosyltransferase [Nitrospiria bacterium]
MDEGLRVLQVNSGDGWSGGQYQVLMLSKGLRDRGHHVVVACPPGSALAEKGAREGLIVEPISMRGQWDIGAVIRFREVMKRHRIQVLNTHKPKPHTLALMAAFFLQVPVVVATRRVSFPLRRHPFTRLKWVGGVDRIIAVAESVRETLIGSGVPKDHVETIYGAIDTERFHPRDPDPALKTELKIPEGMFIVGKVAAFRPWKGYSFFLEAAALVLKEEPNVRFLCIGEDSDHGREMKEKARRLGIEENVTFTGYRDDVERFYPLLNVSVNCATGGEGLPGVLRESMAMAVPVVATDTGGNRELIHDGETGILIPPEDARALAQAILRLIRNPEEARDLGEKGRGFMEGRFSIQAMVSKTEAVYREIYRNKQRVS